MFSYQLVSSQEHVQYQTKLLTCEGSYQGARKEVDESFQSALSQTLPIKEHDHITHREEAPPSEANEKTEENNNKCASSCYEESAHEKINIPTQNNNNDEDDLSAKELLCLAWQIAQGMVSRNWDSPENLTPNISFKGISTG